MKTFTKTNITHKILSVVLNLLLIFYSVAPGVSASLVYAEEATPAATVEEISAEEPQVSPSPSPVVEPTISPEPFPLPSILPEASPEITPSASSSAEPSSTDQIENNTSPEPTVGQPNAPPEESPGPSLSPEPSPSVTVEQPIQGHLSATILENTDASSLQLDLSIQGEVSSASLTTDKADYAPTDTAVITGSDFPKEAELKLIITADNYRFEDKVTTDGNGQFIYTYQLDGVYRPLYNVEAQNLSGQILATTSFTDSQNSNPSADLDQCANDPAPSPSTDGCSASASDWVNGNLGSSKSSYFENDSIPYRMRLENLSLASHTVTIEWDTTKGGKHAIDYLTTFNRTVATANPCLGVSGCSTSSTFSIPVDPQVSGAGVTPVAGNFTLYGGTITAVSAYSYSNGTGFTGDKSARITITFTASVANPVLAWGGHIADRDDWGDDMAAVAIPGSPYHTRLIDLDGSGGNQDRSLSADAVVFPGSITIIKQATPEGSTLFPFTASPSPLSAFSLVDDGTSVNTKAFTDITDFQTYSVNETPLPSGWAFDAINCSVISPNGGSQTPSGSTVSINLKEGENVTCTYTNHQLAGTLLVKKHVVNDNAGTAAASDFTLHVKSGGTDVASSPAAGSESGTSYSLNAGTYNVSEDTPLSGYSNVTTDLNNGDCDGSGNVTVVAGQTKTCTITNDDVVSALHLRKTVTNDNGGTAVNTAWTLTATGTGGSPTNLSGTTPVDSGSDFKADTYALAEINGPAGYAAGAWDCGAATMPDATHVTVPLGGNVTCTINNDDIQPKLTVTKIVTNDNGGTKQVSDFPLFVDQTSVTSGQQNGFNAATYIVSEIQDAGYDATIDGDCAANGSIILNVGDVKSCTITNNDKIAHLTLVKEVINDNNGNATANDWTLSATGPGALQVIAVSGSGSADGDVNAGTYTLSESGPSGYDASAWDCQGGSQNGNQITLNLGESATCNITNDDNAPSLTLLKTVTNDNGGTAVNTAWTLTATGALGSPTNLTGNTPVVSGSNFKADTYTLAESGGPSGYNASQYSCIKNGGAPVVGNSITLGLGDSATCTINNNDNAPSLTLQKIVVKDNGGTALPSDWSLYAIMGNVGIGGTGPTVSSDSTFSAGTYILSETDPSFGYRPSDWVCEGGTQEGDQITLELGQSAICTITNNDIAPILTLIKTVVTNDGGTATEADFQAYINDDPAPWNQAQTLSVGNYTANELANVSGYTPSEWTGDCDADGNVSLAEGENKTCYITNDDIAPSLKLVKEVIKDDGGQANPVDWILTARRLCQAGDPSPSCGFSDSGDSTTFHTLTAGKLYILTESGPDGYAMGSWSCNGGSLTANRLTLGLDEEVTCTITNDDQPGSISGMKFEDEDGDGVKDAEELGLSNWTINISGPVNTSTITDASGNYTFSDLPAGIYTVTESLELGWTQTTSNPSPINLANGQIVTGVNFGNFDLVIISGKKFNDLNGDHIKDSGEPGLEGWIIMLDKVDDILSPVCVGGIIVGEFCTRTTNSSGNYSFSNLGPGTYIVSEVFKDGWTQTRPNASYGGQGAQADGTYLLIVESGDDIEDRDFGNRGNLSITACKYEDSNGTEEGGEFTPVNDWDFNLINNQLTQNTGDSNCTTFENLTPGEYSVSENPLSDGWFVADGSGGTQNITLPTDDTTLNFYNYRKGEIGGLKWNDEDGDGEKADCEWDWWELWDWDWNGFCESGLEDWIIFLDENENGVLDEGEDYAETDEDGFYTFTDLDPGTYRVCEVLQDGWEQTYPDNSELNNCHEVIVSSGEHVEDIDFGNQGRATITVYKNIDTDGDGDIDITNATDWTWDIDGEGDFVTGGDSQEVSAGDYEVSEDQKDNYHVTSVECNNEEQYEPSENIEISVEAGQNLVCTFTNTRDTGSITVIKNIDNTGDGDTDDEGDVQGVTNWTWDIIDGEQNISTGQTKTLPIGTYTASEDQQDGYKLLGWTCSNEQTGTTNSIEINVTSESETFCTFTNQLLPPVLILTKTNDKTGIDVSAGANVRYTLTVSLTGSPVSNVSVIDLPPAGFIYRLGSWTASSSVRGDLKALGITTEPTYASPGTWLLGDMIGGEVVILTYIADINSSTDPGLYKDLAWSKGTGIDSSTVLANESSGFFVGTEVNVVKSLGESTGVEIIKEERGEVLGISAELPATGINTIWVSLAALLLLGGSGLILAGISLRRRYE